MLESVRAYAREKLRQRDDAQAIRLRHADHYLRFAEEHVVCLRTRDEAEALAELEADLDNLRTALDWAGDHDPSLAARLALALHQPLHLRGYWDEVEQRLEQGWAAVQQLGDEHHKLRAALRYHRASLAEDLGRYLEAQTEAEASLVEYRTAEDRQGVADVLNLLALLATRRGEFETAGELCQQALAHRPISDAAGRAKTIHNLARLADLSGDQEEAVRLYEECLLLRRRAGDARGEAITLLNLAQLARKSADHKCARQLYEQSLQLFRTLRQPFYIAATLNNLGNLDAADGALSRALPLLVHAERIFHDLGSPYAAEPARALEELRQSLGAAAYAELRRQAEGVAWEDVTGDASD